MCIKIDMSLKICLQTLLSLSQLISNIIHSKRIEFGEANQDPLLISIVKHVLFLFFMASQGAVVEPI